MHDDNRNCGGGWKTARLGGSPGASNDWRLAECLIRQNVDITLSVAQDVIAYPRSGGLKKPYVALALLYLGLSAKRAIFLSCDTACRTLTSMVQVNVRSDQ